jgi:LPS-assembly protein
MNWTYGFLKPSSSTSTPSINWIWTAPASPRSLHKPEQKLNGTFDSNQNRGVPIASVDSGLYFDRNTSWFGKNYRQTLEPRLFYLYVPKGPGRHSGVRHQRNTFNYASLFRDNRFSAPTVSATRTSCRWA